MTDDPNSVMRLHARAYDEVVRQAQRLVDSARCHCDASFTNHGRHDPKGCLWAEIADLRAAVEAEQKALREWRDDNKKRLKVDRL